MFEVLEARRHLSISLLEGTLLVESAAVPSQVIVEYLGSAYRVHVNADMVVYPASAVQSISVRAGAGHDYIRLTGVPVPAFVDGGAGNDTILGGNGNDWLLGGDGDDQINGGWGDDELRGGWGSDTLRGGLGNDTVRGAGGNDWVYGGEGNDLVVGGADDDWLDGKEGADTIQGGTGIDTVDYSARTVNLVIRLDNLPNDGAAGENDNVLTDVENIVSGSGNDLLVGSDAPNTFWAGPGNDTMDGGWGNDTLWGGDGFDTGDYSSRTMLQQLRINEGTGVPGEQDIPHDDIECLIGGAGDDWIQGADNDNLLIGNGGNDTLIGFGGNDTLIGGLGADLLGHDDSGPRPGPADAGDDLIYTCLPGQNDDGAADRITDEIGQNVLHYSTNDPDVILTGWPGEQAILA